MGFDVEALAADDLLGDDVDASLLGPPSWRRARAAEQLGNRLARVARCPSCGVRGQFGHAFDCDRLPPPRRCGYCGSGPGDFHSEGCPAVPHPQRCNRCGSPPNVEHRPSCPVSVGAVLATDPRVGSLVRRAREGTPHAYGMTALAFPRTRLEPNQPQHIHVQPQVAFGGPYRFAFRQIDGLLIHSLNVGNEALILSPGATLLALWNFDPGVAPSGLTPINGPVCRLGYVIRVCVENKGPEPVDFDATIWGYSFEALELRREMPNALAAVQSLINVEHAGAKAGDLMVFDGLRWVRARELERALANGPRKEGAGVSGSRDAAAAAPCLPSPPAGERTLAPLPPVKCITAQEYIWQQRRDADRAASAAHAEAHPPPPRLEPEPEKEWWQEQWSTANDES